MKQETASGMKPVPNKNIIMAVTLLGMFMAVLDSVIVSIALPTITAYFHADLSLSQWTITGYLVTMTATMLVFARLSAYYGKNRIFLFGMTVFTASSLGCAFAPSLPVLIALRILQGLGAAMSVSILMAIIFDIHSFHEHGKAMGILGATVALASISGPILGGFLVELCGWQSIFLINIPIGVVLLVLGYFSMDLKKPVLSCNFIMDRAGAGTLIIAVASFMLALGFIGEGGVASLPGAVCGCLCPAALAIFIRTEHRHPCPLINLNIFSVRRFVVPLLSMCFFFSAIMILYVTLPLYLESVMAFTPSQVGWFFVLMAAIVTVGSPLVGRAYDRFSWKSYTPAGLMVAAIGFLFFSVSTGTTDIAILAAALIVVAIGFALIQSPVNTEIMRGLPQEQSATASGLNSVGRHFAMAFGSSMAALIFALCLHDAGYSGTVTGADPALVAGTASLALATAGILCIAGVVLNIVINERKPGQCPGGGMVVLGILVVLPVILHFLFPVMQVVFPPYTYTGIAAMLLGLGLMILAAREFCSAGTGFTLQEGGATLVTSGPFGFCRNPMYLGMLVWLFGFAVLLGSLIVFILPAVFFLLAHFVIIPVEEKRMEQGYGEQYIVYRRWVGRWL